MLQGLVPDLSVPPRSLVKLCLLAFVTTRSLQQQQQQQDHEAFMRLSLQVRKGLAAIA
jgi:hypothetical protein